MGGGESKPPKPSIPSSLSAIKTYNVNNTIPLKKYKSVSLNNFGPCEKEGCTKYETVQETCGQECVKYRTVCRGVPGGRSRKAICHKECVKTEPKMCDTQRCVEYKCTKRKSINELNGMEIPQIHERIEKMKNIVNVYEQNSKIVMDNFREDVKSKLPSCFGTQNGDCNSCSYKTWYAGHPCCKDTCSDMFGNTWDCDCHPDCERGWRSHSLSGAECELKKSTLDHFACNGYVQLPKWKC
jgi:hypothetical protein